MQFLEAFGDRDFRDFARLRDFLFRAPEVVAEVDEVDAACRYGRRRIL